MNTQFLNSEWIQNPKLAHKNWRNQLLIADRAYSVQSQRLYCSLFGRFIDFVIAEKSNLSKITGIQIAAFLDTLSQRKVGLNKIEQGSASNRTKRTYLAEIDRVLSHLVSIGIRNDNPAQALINTLRITNPLTSRNIEVLPLTTQNLYLEKVDALEKKYFNSYAIESIIEIQSITMNLLMLELGLTLKEIQKLRLKNLESITNGSMYTPGHRVLEDRTLQLTPRAQKWLMFWQKIRSKLKVYHTESYRLLKKANPQFSANEEVDLIKNARNSVFVAFSSKGEKRVLGVITDKIPESSIFLSAQQVLLLSFPEISSQNIELKRKGPQILRNTFCANLFSKNCSLEEMMRICGLRIPNQIWAMQRHIKEICYISYNNIE